MSTPDVWTEDATGLQPAAPISPNAWAGELDCLIGPFDSREVAHTFVALKVNFAELGSVLERTFAQGDAWYVELKVLTL